MLLVFASEEKEPMSETVKFTCCDGDEDFQSPGEDARLVRFASHSQVVCSTCATLREASEGEFKAMGYTVIACRDNSIESPTN